MLIAHLTLGDLVFTDCTAGLNASTEQQADAIERALIKRHKDWLIDDRGVPEMLVKGSKRKIRIKALLPNQTEEDALKRVTLQLTREGLDTRKADKLVSALVVFSRKEAGWSKGKSGGKIAMSEGGEEMDEVMQLTFDFHSFISFLFIDVLQMIPGRSTRSL